MSEEERTKPTWKDPWFYLSVAVNVAVHHLWFFSTATLTYWDTAFNFPEQLRQIASFQTWSLESLGRIAEIPSAYPYNYLSGLLARAGFSGAFIPRLVLFWPMVIVGALGSYLLVKKVSGSGVGGLVGSVVFNFNSFFIVHSSSQITIAAAIAWFPLTLYLFLELAEGPSLRRALACSVPLFVVSFLEFRVFYVCCLPLVLLYLFSLPEGRARKGLPAYTGLFFLPLAVTILLNAYWLIPYYLGGLEKGLQDVIVGRPLFTGGIAGTNLLHNAFAIFHPMWSGGKLEAFSVHPIPFYWFLVPLLAFSTLLFDKLRRDGRVLFFSLLALVGIFLTKFIFPPFPGAYGWLYRNFPGFNAFREPSKFTFLIYLPYAVLIGCLVGHLLRRAGRGGWKPVAALLLAALVSLPFLAMAVPVATGSAGALFVGRDIPDDYLVLKDFLRAQPGFFRTLWVPTFSRWSYYDDDHPRVSCVEALKYDWKELQEAERSDLSIPENIVDILKRSFSAQLLRSASIAYVVVPLQDVANDDDFFVSYGGDRQFFIDQLDGLDYLEEMDIGTQELAVYRNRAHDPLVFSPRGLCRLDPEGEIDPQYLLARSIWGEDLPFTLDEVPASAIRVEDLLAAAAQPDLASPGDVRVDVPPPGAGETLSLYADRGRGELRCLLADGEVTFRRVEAGRLLLDGQPLEGSEGGRETLLTVEIGLDEDCWLVANGIWIYLEKGKETSLGRMDRISSLRIYGAGYPNLIPNGSFEQGLWTEQVIDCHAYDDRPALGMSLTEGEASDGRHALQLEATRHVAGTSTTFPVEGNRDYSFGFDYQSPNAKEVGYYLEFDDGDRTAISERLPVTGSAWQHFQRRLTTPLGASEATLSVYSCETDGQTRVITRYDRFKFSRSTEGAGLFYTVRTVMGFEAAAAVWTAASGPTKKVVEASPGAGPFVLVLSQKYDVGWKLAGEKGEVDVGLEGRIPLTEQAGEQGEARAEYHFNVDGGLNAWYIDPRKSLAGGMGEEGAEGHLILQLVLEFHPQRQARMGSLLSLVTVLAVLALVLEELLRAWGASLKRRRGSGKPAG